MAILLAVSLFSSFGVDPSLRTADSSESYLRFHFFPFISLSSFIFISFTIFPISAPLARLAA